MKTMPTPRDFSSWTTRNRASISRPVSAAVGLVQDQQAGVLGEGLGDLDELLAGDAELADWLVEVDVQADPVQGCLGDAAHLLAVDHAEPLGGGPSVMFSATLSCGTRFSSWWMVAMPCRSAALTSGS